MHRLAELVGSLSLATDSANGVAPETALRVAWLSERFARALDLSLEARSDAYYAGVLRFVGCTSYAHETARLAAGDDRAMLASMMTVDASSVLDRLEHATRGLAPGAPMLARASALVRLTTSVDAPSALATAHCAQAEHLAARLGMTEGVLSALGAMYERWDGRGLPRGLGEEESSLVARVVHAAFRVETHRAALGVEAARDAVHARRGRELDPRLVDVFSAIEDELWLVLGMSSVWDVFLEAEPLPQRRVDAAFVATLAEAFGDYADLKSPYLIGHSPRVATRAREAARGLGCDEPSVQRVHLAGLLHDLGRVAVPNGIWDKPGPLQPIERERAEAHAWHTARILGRSPLLAALAPLAGAAHERCDASGYPRAVQETALPLEAHVLAAADVACALAEPRPHRPALDAASRVRVLREEVDRGRLSRVAVDAVLSVEGVAPASSAGPDGLSDREVEVLVWLARGLSNKEIASALAISPKTVQHHVTHIYAKTGLSSRAALALYAVGHRLVTA